MKRLITLIIISLLALPIEAKEKIKVACVGNSITFGSRVANRTENSYPAQLQTYLGDEYTVSNFGVSGMTLLSKGDHPYINRAEYRASLEFNPDIVFIKLGTNDSKSVNMVHFADYKSDYQKMIDSYKNLSSKPRIILITPLRCYMAEGKHISDMRMKSQITPAIKELAYSNNIEIFDGYSLFGEDYESHLMPDRLHPSSIGAGVMAANFYRLLTVETDSEFDIFERLDGGEDFNFHGFSGRDYSQDGLKFKVVKPKIANKRHSWVIRARFWGHEPQLDQKLLELGFHVVYCDVENLFGAKSAVKRWDKFYDIMTSVGLNKRVVLEGMSRGGLIVYNWAAKNTNKVSAIYADAPVLDLKSWPMGEGIYSGSEVNEDLMLKAYGMSSREQMLKFKGNPIDHAKKIAKAGVPIIHVVGGADVIVPFEENSAIFIDRVESAGGEVKLINKSDVGHHPHSLSAPEPILDFILKAEGVSENICIKPLRGNEYRGAAGWRNGADWNAVSREITTVLKSQDVDILMLGNSITQGFSVNRELTWCNDGQNRELANIFGDLSWESAGISGDKTQHLLWRVKNGEYNSATPKYVTIAIGVNNLLGGEEDSELIYQGIVAVTEAALVEFPSAKIVLFGMLPTAVNVKMLEKSVEIIDKLRDTKFGERVLFVDPMEHFADENGELRKDLYSSDMIHLVGKGYRVWAELIMKSINSF